MLIVFHLLIRFFHVAYIIVEQPMGSTIIAAGGDLFVINGDANRAGDHPVLMEKGEI